MAADKVRMSIEVSKEVVEFLEQLASEEATTKTEIMRRAFCVMKVYKQQKQFGNTHIGFTSDPSKLNVELVGILDS